MPNHITNILDVTGSAKEVAAFKKLVYHISKEKGHEGLFDFNATVPMPAELEGTTSPAQDKKERELQAGYIKKYGAGNWYDWKCNNWGTKWGAYHCGTPSKIDGGIRFQFDTAWSPPGEWLEKTAKLHPSLEFTDSWIDEGGGAGRYTLHGDEVDEESLDDEDWMMEFNPDYAAEYTFITEGNYDEVLKKYSKMDEPDYWSLNKVLINRLQKKHLPLFLGYDWGNSEDAFQSKLKGETKSE